MTLQEAIAIARKKDPDLVPISGAECKNWFKFSMVTRKGEAIGNGCTYAVNKKTGECGWKSLFADMKFVRDPIIKLHRTIGGT